MEVRRDQAISTELGPMVYLIQRLHLTNWSKNCNKTYNPKDAKDSTPD